MAFRNKAVLALAAPLQRLLSFQFSEDCHLQKSPNVCCPSAAVDRVGTEQERTIAAPSDSNILEQCPGCQGSKLQTHLLTYSLSHLFNHLLSICYGLCIARDTREAGVGKCQCQALAGFAFWFRRTVNRSYSGGKHSSQYYVEM